MRTKFSIDAEIKKTDVSDWEVIRFEQIARDEKAARREVIKRAERAGFAQVGMQRTVSKQHAI